MSLSQNSKNSLPIWSKQLMNFNKNSIELLASVQKLIVSNEQSILLNYTDVDGTVTSFTLPTINAMNARMDRMERSINNLGAVESSGSFIQVSETSFKKIITADLNLQPNTISDITLISNFFTKPNWIFDNMLNPLLLVELDLTGKIEKNVKNVLSRRYIVEFEKNSDGQLTVAGSEALSDFIQRWKNKNNIDIAEFTDWLNITGVSNAFIDEQNFNLEANKLRYRGLFTVLSVEEDVSNKKLWYILDRLDYLDNTTGLFKQIKINDEFVLNNNKASSIYQILEINTDNNKIKVRFNRVSGYDPIPVGIGVLKIYSPIVNEQKVRVSISQNEYDVIFIKAINDNNLLSDEWSQGVAFYSNDLRYIDENNQGLAGMFLSDFYVKKVYNYGLVFDDIAKKKIPDSLGLIPNPPFLSETNFNVVQVNQHLTNSTDIEKIRQLHNNKNTLKSEIDELNNAIKNKQKDLLTKKLSIADKSKIEVDIKNLTEKVVSKNKLLANTVSEIVSNQKIIQTADPKFSLRGAWDFPVAQNDGNSRPQETIQYRVRYKRSSLEGQENPTKGFKIQSESGEKNAYFSNWVEFLTDKRKGVFNTSTGFWEWEPEDLSNADTVNIGQFDIPIEPYEKITFQIKSISEVGWPDNPLESDWSEEISKEFPTDLINTNSEDQTILNQAIRDDVMIQQETELEIKGVLKHLEESLVDNNKYIAHHAKSIITDNIDNTSAKLMSVQEALNFILSEFNDIQNTLKRIKGELKVKIVAKGKEIEMKNKMFIGINYVLLDYSEKDANASTAFEYINKIYTLDESESVKIRINNSSTDNPLGLLSYKSEDDAIGITDSSSIRPVWIDENNTLIPQTSRQFMWVKNKRLGSNVENYKDLASTNPEILNPNDMQPWNIGYKSSIVSNLDADDVLASIKYVGTPPSTANSRRFVANAFPIMKSSNNVIGTGDVKVLSSVDTIEVPISIKFCLDTLNPGNNTSINLNQPYYANHTQTKSLTFKIEPENSTDPFEFQIDFRFIFQRPNSSGLSNILVSKSLTSSLPTRIFNSIQK